MISINNEIIAEKFDENCINRFDNIFFNISYEEIEKLGSEKKKYTENALTTDEEIDTLKKQISYYKSIAILGHNVIREKK